MDIYVVYEEFQKDTPLFHGAFANRAQAEAFAAHLRRKRRGEGRAVYFRESPLRDGWAEEDTEEADWEVDVHVEELELVG